MLSGGEQFEYLFYPFLSNAAIEREDRTSG